MTVNLDIKNLKPYNGRILVEVLKKEESYEGSLILAPSCHTKEYTNFGRVYRVSDDSTKFAVGDIIVYPLHTGASFISGSPYKKDEQVEFRILREEEVYGKIIES